MKGICINNSDSIVLKKGEIYYLFEHNATYVYASRFPVVEAHCGCFQKNRFQLMNQTIPILEENKIYKARLHYNNEFKTPLGIYYISQTKYNQTPSKTHCYVYKDPELKQAKGCFPIAWFTDFEEITKAEETVPEKVELPEEEWEQLDIFYVLDNN